VATDRLAIFRTFDAALVRVVGAEWNGDDALERALIAWRTAGSPPGVTVAIENIGGKLGEVRIGDAPAVLPPRPPPPPAPRDRGVLNLKPRQRALF
jgi:hypothetical protein